MYTHTTKFGSLPKGHHRERILRSPHYKNGQFQNLQPADCEPFKHRLKNYKEFCKTVFEFMANRGDIGHSIPSMKTNLMNLDRDDNILIWFGHSSYFIQIDGKRLIVDPVFSEVASPVPFFPKALPGTNAYTPNEIPELDYLIITHDHWDHLDYATVMGLKVSSIICPLGVGAHFERWGLKNVAEMDWNESAKLADGFTIDCLPARHFSGRGWHKNQSLWASFLIQTPNIKIYIGGDGGYGEHFRAIGNKFIGIDLAILENGQYNINWRDVHMFPEDTVRATEDLKAKALLPIHNSKFILSTHPWNEPLDAIAAICECKNFQLLTPVIGQKVELKNLRQTFSKWWTKDREI
jgi:L-ascorbate metabolism protein UlaG (beta-lactamase superfamily)